MIHDGILPHDPFKPANYVPNVSGVYKVSFAEGIECLSIASEAVVKESVEVLFRYRVGGVVIKQVPLHGDFGSGTPAPLRPPDTAAACMVRIDSVDPEQAQGEHHRQCENDDA